MTQPLPPEPHYPVPYSPAPYAVHQTLVPGYPPSAAPTYGPTYHGIVPARPVSQAAVWALILAVTGLMMGWCLLGIPNVLSIVLGHAGLSETKTGAKSGAGMSTAALIIGYVTVLPSVLIFLFVTLGMIGAAA